jgi:hypothetical protein
MRADLSRFWKLGAVLLVCVGSSMQDCYYAATPCITFDTPAAANSRQLLLRTLQLGILVATVHVAWAFSRSCHACVSGRSATAEVVVAPGMGCSRANPALCDVAGVMFADEVG